LAIFEFFCKICGNEKEILFTQSDEDSDIVICQKCGALMVKQMSKNSFRLKGQGWSKDGYCKKN
jgi:putative FmdB family regulatory protein